MKKYLSDIDLDKRILEIGPLASPLLKKNEADVYYADILSTQAVKALYQVFAEINKEAICEIDFVIHGSYTETFKDIEKFDYILASHVLEHMPRLIEFFQDTVNVLNAHGQMYLLLPDSRYCFDHFRSPTSFAELYYIHTQELAFAPWQVLDSSAYVQCNDPCIFWTDRQPFQLLTRREPFADTRERFEKALTGEFTPGDCSMHYSAFTPSSFLLLLHEMTRAGVLPYKLVRFFPTSINDFTFGAVLEACPELQNSAELSEREMDRLRMEMTQLVEYEDKVYLLPPSLNISSIIKYPLLTYTQKFFSALRNYGVAHTFHLCCNFITKRYRL